MLKMLPVAISLAKHVTITEKFGNDRNPLRSRHDGGAVAAFLGGIVVWGSNRSTSKEGAKELTATEEDRGALIEMINPRVIP